MDVSHLGAITSSLGIAKDMAKAMVGIRDWNLIAEKTTALNDQLLKMQEALLAHNAALFELQNEHFKTCEELRKLQEAASERGRYALVELGQGHFAYRVNVAPEARRVIQPAGSEPLHYLCQPCFDNGRKAVLQRNFVMSEDNGLLCPVCKTQVFD